MGTPRFDRVQFVESNLLFGSIAYVHMCHRAYLADHWMDARPKGLLHRAAVWLDHWLHSLAEPLALRRPAVVVVPSRGLARELARHYPSIARKTKVLANPVDVDLFARTQSFDRRSFRSRQGLSPEDVVLSFVALGQFEAKGLPRLIDAIARLKEPTLKLLVVGGNQSTVSTWRRRVKDAGIEAQVVFTGLQIDVRPFLWASDGFALPSTYEAFSLVGHEAAAAALPLIVTPVFGMEEFVRDGVNAILTDATVECLVLALSRFIRMTPSERQRMGEEAAQAVGRREKKAFIEGWRVIYTQP
jgi:glycosyltransferase involved in cell wall biosynthesis